MGSNFTDYLREANRTLKVDGHLHVIEAIARFTDRNRFLEGLNALGFDLVNIEEKWKFTHIRAIKSDRKPHEDIQFGF